MTDDTLYSISIICALFAGAFIGVFSRECAEVVKRTILNQTNVLKDLRKKTEEGS